MVGLVELDGMVDSLGGRFRLVVMIWVFAFDVFFGSNLCEAVGTRCFI